MRHLMPFLLLATACSPYLQYRQDSAHAYGFTAPCGQGPFTLTTRLTGARWGERLTIAGFAPHAVVSDYAIKLDGKPFSSGRLAPEHLVTNGTYTVMQTDQQPQNERCVQRPVVVAPQPARAPEPGWQPPPGQVAVQAAPTEAPKAMPVAQLVSLDPGVFVAEANRNFNVASFTWTSTDDMGTPPMHADAELAVTFWSQEPNDWDGAMIQIIHEIAAPSVPEAEYIAYLHKQRLEAQADQKKREDAFQAESQARANRCQKHHKDEDCWGKGGYDAYVKAYYAPRPDAPTQQQRPVVQPTAPVAHAPDGPPPPAQAESEPPKPSEHAEWIAGYWHWTGFTWYWLGGWWKVPQSDLLVTVVAPSPPPQRVAELRAGPPIPGAVWLAGAWYWQSGAWRWHPGQWALPPQPGLQWQPPSWVAARGGVRLVPGAWGATVRAPRP